MNSPRSGPLERLLSDWLVLCRWNKERPETRPRFLPVSCPVVGELANEGDGNPSATMAQINQVPLAQRKVGSPEPGHQGLTPLSDADAPDRERCHDQLDSSILIVGLR